ncbi:beta-1,4-galactosyltransferase galt-1-like [Gigantopelta aegis]|uniref:beta-1,4-galactosyltransferase galt-1-like n=1 Tax=Gigantopelta aegis TaxID=1735272 RepID=UPI001B88E6F0|nr:beta-1,4-galactosyltransferase galt-1-like [Gigantopelta aegis]
MNSRQKQRFLLIVFFIYCVTTFLILFLIQQNLSVEQNTHFGYEKSWQHELKELLSFPYVSSCRWKKGYKRLSEKMLVKLSDDVIMYSAYQDNRTGTPLVRIMSALMDGADISQLSLWCHFSDDENISLNSYSSSRISFYEMCENHLKPYGGWILSCELPSNMYEGRQPCFVSVKSETLGNTATLPILRTEPLESNKQIEFAVCVPPLFGDVSKETIIQFVEMVQQLGASQIVFYNHSVTRNVDNVLNYYTSNYIVSVLPWTLSLPPASIWYNGQSIAMNDCMYRHMTTIQNIIFMDLDEFLIPHSPKATTWGDIVNEVKHDNVCGYSFKSAAFSITSYGKQMDSSPLIANLTTRNVFSMYRNKVLVQPYKVLEIGIHHVSRPWPDEKRYTVHNVDPIIAFIHHYRDCSQIHECGGRVEDRTLVDKYAEQLKKNFHKVYSDSGE